jgi:alpha-tubulin suppressor-like RCC1 family protein
MPHPERLHLAPIRRSHRRSRVLAVAAVVAMLALALATPVSAAVAVGRVEDADAAASVSPPPGLYAVAAGTFHTCALTSVGGVKCWGANARGEIGDGTTTNRSTPVPVVGLSSGVVSVAAGYLFTCALTSGGGVKCWGNNDGGQLGDGTTTDRTTPVDVVGLTSGVVQLDATDGGGCAVTSTGGVKCWGQNYGGEVGDGTRTARLTPVDVVGLTSGVAQVTGGGIHACAVTTGGAAKCWGYNQRGELGDGTRTTRLTPVDVVGLGSGVGSMDAGGIHTCAVTVAGAAKCWGYNDSGELGDGTRSDRYTPVDVVGLGSGVAGVSAGDHDTCALMTSGGARCWGSGGILGDGTWESRLTPVGVVGLDSGVVQLAAGTVHTCALTTAPGIKCWGSNIFGGSVGDGTTDTARLSPVDVSGSFYRPECPTLLASDNTGFVLADGYAVGSVATFAADPGYRLVGTGTLGCQAGLTWSGPVPIAVPAPESIVVTPGTGGAVELDDEMRDVEVPVHLSVPPPEPVTIEWTTLFVPGAPDGQADPGTDYLPASGTLSLAAGQTDASVTVTILPDQLVEADEYVVVSFHDPVGAVMGGFWGLGFGLIRDDDVAFALPGVGQAIEGDAGTTTVEVPITLTAASSRPITVAWTTLAVVDAPAGQATEDVDYTPVSGTVTFLPGETTATVSITVGGDTEIEPDEYIVVSFHDPVGALMGGFWGLGFGTIANDD